MASISISVFQIFSQLNKNPPYHNYKHKMLVKNIYQIIRLKIKLANFEKEMYTFKKVASWKYQITEEKHSTCNQ